MVTALQRVRLELIPIAAASAIATGRGSDLLPVVESLAAPIAHWYLAGLADAGPRGGTVDALAQRLAGTAAADAPRHDLVAQALETALRQARAGDRVLVFGSFHTAAAALDWLARH